MASAAPKLPGAVRALLETGGALVRRSSSGRVALARAAPLVDPAALPRATAGLPAPRPAAMPGRPAQLEAARGDACVPLDAMRARRALQRLDLESFDDEPLAVTP